MSPALRAPLILRGAWFPKAHKASPWATMEVITQPAAQAAIVVKPKARLGEPWVMYPTMFRAAERRHGERQLIERRSSPRRGSPKIINLNPRLAELALGLATCAAPQLVESSSIYDSPPALLFTIYDLHNLTGGESRGPGPLKVVATQLPRHIHHFADKVEPRNAPGFHCL